MKNCYFIIFCLLALPIMVFAQKTFPTSMSFTFSGGNNGKMAAVGNDCGLPTKDVDIQYNSIDGNMEITVNKICHSWSFVQHWMGNAFVPSIVFKNRYLEFRIFSSSIATGLSVGFQCSDKKGSLGKTIPSLSYGVSEAETWQVKFFKLGGNCDTIFAEVDYFFPNGFYKFDYLYYGDAAIPPLPTIDIVKDKNVSQCAGVQNVSLTGIEIPGRLYDGLKISAEAKSDGFIKDVSIVDLGGGSKIFIDEENKSATLQYAPVSGMAGMSDSIIVTLQDTIRGTIKRMAFKVAILSSGCADLASNEDKISVYPTVTKDVTSIEFPELISGDIAVVNLIGNIVASQKLNSQSKATVDLSAVAPGVYFITISDGSSIITKKIVKE